jgi:unsaturated rhamnogalacturonyl hydrolase
MQMTRLVALLPLGLLAAARAQTLPAPADKAHAIPINTTLQWPADPEATGYEVYLGTTSPPAFQCMVPKAAFLLETLSANKTYHWFALPVYKDKRVRRSPPEVLSFTTEAKPAKDALFAWPITMANTIRGLYPQPANLGEWNYTQGMIADALVSIALRTGRDADIDYTKAWLDRFVNADGTIRTWDAPLHSLDRFRPGPALLQIYDRTKDEKYRKAADFLAQQLEQQPKTSDGGYWHRQTYPNQMWLDGIYMADVFSAAYAAKTNQPQYFDEAVKQILLIHQHTHNPKTGLYYHGWDETKTRPWADKTTGASPEFWGRAIGWYAMAMVDIMDYLPQDHPGREKVLPIFKDLCQALAKVQDHDTGMWWQILDQPAAPKNYVETSCSIMYCYAMARGVQRGYLSAEYLETARRGTRGILNQQIDLLPNNRVNIRGTVQVGSLSGAGNYDYYVNVPVVTNDQKSLGAMMYLTLALSETANP